MLDEICGQMYVYFILYAIYGVEIYEWRDFYVAHGNFLSTEHTEDTEKIIVEDYFQDFILDLHHRLFLSCLSIVKARSHSVFATPKHLAKQQK